MRSRLQSESGFSLPEMLVAAAIMVTVVGAVFTVMNPAQGAYRTQPEVSDLQQRLRIGSDTLSKDLVMAGGGMYAGGMTGALSNYFAPVMPHKLSDPSLGIYFRAAQGAANASDAVSFFYVPSTGAQTTIREDMPQPSSELKVEPQPNCPPAKLEQLCGFYDGMRAIIFDDTGSWDPMTITQVQPAALHMQHKDPLSKSYQKGAVIAMAATRTYYLKTDDATKTYELRLADGVTDLPVVENVVKLEIEYYGDPRAPVLLPNKSLSDPVGPYTTYGPKPPALGVNNPNDSWGAGENCVYQVVAGQHAPRLPDLPGGVGQVQLTQAMLTDGPWCPDAAAVMRYDADLLRLRRVRIKLRLQAPIELRGPAGALFSRAGTNSAGQHFVPDQEVAFDITPRNLNLGR
jgi:prepilin-type N-terminal cleavage/methylation domain-containing protein